MEAIIVVRIPIIVIQTTQADIIRIIPIPTAREETKSKASVAETSLIPNAPALKPIANFIPYRLFTFFYPSLHI